MASQIELLLEAEKRGLLTPANKALLEEARARGLVPAAGAAAPKPEEVGTAEGMGRAVVQGGMFGFGDEVVAGGVATRNWLGNALGAPETFGSVPGKSWSEVYDASLNAERDRINAFREQSPVLAYGSEIVGALPTAIATGGTGQAATLGGRMALGAANAGAQGVAYGFGAGEGGFQNRAVEAGKTGALSAVGGAAVPALASGVRNVVGRVAANRAADNVGMPAPAMNLLRRTMSVDDSLTGAGQQRIQAAGPDGMLADAGPMGQNVLDTAIQSSGPAGAMARQAVDGRVANATRQVASALDNALGAPAGPLATETALREGTKQARSAAYQAAYSQPIDYSSDVGRAIEQLVENHVPQEAIDAANRLMRLDPNATAKQIMASIADDGTVTFREMPSVEQLDYITRGLKELADAADGQGKLGGQTAIGRATGNLATQIRDLMKKAVPEYATALETAAEPIQARNALLFGRDIMSARLTREQVAETVAQMTPAERAYAAQGVRAQIDEALANVKAAFTDSNMDAREAAKALRDLSSRAAREKVEALIGPDAAADMFRQLDQATTAFELRAAVADNSKTFARQETARTMGAITNDGPVNAFRAGEPVVTAKALWQALMGGTATDRLRLNDETATALVRALTEDRGNDAVNILMRLNQAHQMLEPIQANAGLLSQALMRPLPAPVASSIRQ